MDSFYDGIRMKSFLMIHCTDVSYEKFPDEVGVDALVNYEILNVATNAKAISPAR